MHRRMSRHSLARTSVRPLSTRTTCVSSGPSGWPGARGPRMNSLYTDSCCAVAERASRLRKSARSRSRGRIFSMPTSAMWHRVAARQKRELPSFVTTTIRPLSATTKFAPVRPASAPRYLCLRNCRARFVMTAGSSSEAPSPFLSKSSAICQPAHRPHHRLELHEPRRPPRLEDRVHGLARRLGRRRPVDRGAVRQEPRLDGGKERVEVLDHVPLDLARELPQAVRVAVMVKEELPALLVLDLGPAVHGCPGLGGKRGGGLVDGLGSHGCRFSASRRTCAKCIVLTGKPSRAANPDRCMRQLVSPETRTSGFAARTWPSFRSPMAAEMCGKPPE